MSKFFINRPIVAMVIAIVTVIVGAVTIAGLPVAQFPNIAPPEIQVLATYVGADAQTLEQAVATPIEQQMSGVDNMNYMYSLNATGNSQTTLIVNFDVKTDPNTDLILAQSRETQAASQLPIDVTNYGITVRKSVTAPLMLIAVYSPHGTYDARFLANYAFINLVDPITRSKGIGQVQVFGAGQYAMRLWVKPDQLAKLGITVTEIVSAIQSQNTVNPAGRVGGEPIPSGQQFAYAVRAQGRLVSPEEFGQIVVRESPQGGVVRVKDVARVELGAQDYSVAGRLNGKPSAIVAVYQLPGSNAVDAANGVKKLMAEMKNRFPSDMDFTLALDSTRVRRRGHKGNHYYVVDRDWPRDHGRVPVSSRMARHADSAAGGAGLIGRHVRALSFVRLLHQYPLVIWFGAGDWPGGGRRHRGGGSRGTSHRRRDDSERCGLESDGGNLRPGSRNRAGTVGRIYSHRFHPGHYRKALSAIRSDHCHLRAALGVQRLEPQPRTGCTAAAPQETQPRSSEKVLRRI